MSRLRRRFVVATALAVVALAAVAIGTAGAADLHGGAKIGVQADPATATAFCPSIRESGSDAMVLSVSRPNVDKGGGLYTFNGVDSGIDAERACGAESGLRVFGQRNDETRQFPADPDGYAAFLTALASHEAARSVGVHRYAIENEVEVVNHWNDTPEHYFDLLRTAHTALHAGDPNAIVLDATLSVAGLYTVRINQLYNSGQKAGALTLYRLMITNVLGGENPAAQAIDTEDELGAYLAGAQAQRDLRFYALMLQNQASFDAFQLHFYGPPSRIPELVGMLRADGMTKPIEAWELGHRYRDGRPFSDADWAGEVSRLITTATGEGSRFTILQLLTDRLEDNLEYGILTPQGQKREAFYSFTTTARMLEGALNATRLEKLPEPAAGYRFDGPRGPLFGGWALSGMPRIGTALGTGTTAAAVTGSEGIRASQMLLRPLAALPAPRWVQPDLILLERLASKSTGGARKLRLRLTCPPASPRPACTGTLRVTGKSRGRKVRLATVDFSVAAGKQRTRSVDLHGPGKPLLTVAEAHPCPAGVKPCRTTLHRSSAKR